MKRLFLDDDPTRRKRFLSMYPGATIAEAAEDCIAALDNGGSWDEVYLDHDLLGSQQCCWSDDSRSGMEVVRHVERRTHGLAPVPLRVGLFVIHTANTCAAMEMGRRLVMAGYTAALRPAYTFLAPDARQEAP